MPRLFIFRRYSFTFWKSGLLFFSSSCTMRRATKDYYLRFARYSLFCYACVSLAVNWLDFYPLLDYVDPFANDFAFD